MSKNPSPKADALRAMREAEHDKRQASAKALAELRRKVDAIPATKPKKAKARGKQKID